MSRTSEDLNRLEAERRDILQALFWEGGEGADESALEERLQGIEELIEQWQRGITVVKEEERRGAEEQKRQEAQLREAHLEELNKLLEKKLHVAKRLDDQLYGVPDLIKEYLEIGRDAYASAENLGIGGARLFLSDDQLIGYLRALFWGLLPRETLEPGPVFKKRLAEIEMERRRSLKP